LPQRPGCQDNAVTSSDRTYYGELDVREDATPSRIRSAFRKLARRYHPDRNPRDDAAEANFKRINTAYLVLSDAAKREAYDETLRAAT
jgi:molecular chaperone DnaJ